jgi:catalase
VLVNLNGELDIFKLSIVVFQFHWKTDQKIKNFNREQADEMAKNDPDFSIRDLYNSIAEGKFPSWTL